jgi:hypothetical protein
VDIAVYGLLAISGLLTLACWVSLWRGPDPVIAKLAWTVVAAFPMIGPLVYAGMHDPPSVQDEVDRAQPTSSWDVPPSDHHHHPP